MPLAKDKCLLISCRAVAPFVDVRLVEKGDDGELKCVAGAGDTPIDKVLKRLVKLDDEYNLHTIPSVVDVLVKGCWDCGYSLTISIEDLLDDEQVTVIKDIATLVYVGSKKV